MNNIKTYDGPGRARKSCPEGHYVHAKSALCVCGHRFRPDSPVLEAKPTSTYDGAGKGRKQCPACSTYVGVRTSTCVCGHSFVESKQELAIPRHSEGGRGRKQCGKCKQFVGVRTRACECGYEFVTTVTVDTEIDVVIDESVDEDDIAPMTVRHRLGYPNNKCTLIPAGDCPVKLTSTDKDVVVDWIEKVQQVFISKNEILAPSGFIYYASHFYNNFTAEHRQVKQIINNYFAILFG